MLQHKRHVLKDSSNQEKITQSTLAIDPQLLPQLLYRHSPLIIEDAKDGKEVVLKLEATDITIITTIDIIMIIRSILQREVLHITMKIFHLLLIMKLCVN